MAAERFGHDRPGPAARHQHLEKVDSGRIEIGGVTKAEANPPGLPIEGR
ncbi:hypothetical protein [Actinoplanes philippinensis]